MPKDGQPTKDQIWRVHLIQAFFDSAHKGQLPEFLTSDELERFLHEGASGAFGTRIPEGGHGSKIPETGAREPLDVLEGLFHGLGSGLGRIDHPGTADPAGAYGDADFEGRDVDSIRIRELRVANGDEEDSTTINVILRNGTVEAFYEVYDSHGEVTEFGHAHDASRTDSTGTFESVLIESNGEGFKLSSGTRDAAGERTYGRSHYFDRQGRLVQSPGEDGGGDTNSGKNPLGNIEALGPQSMGQMLSGMQHPGRDSEQVDPNSGLSGFKLTESDKERLGRTAPAAEVLDPNSGVDPLSALNLDPNQIHTRSEKDDRVDPNTGLKPVPGGGSG